MIKGLLKNSISVMLLVLLVACVASCTSYKKVPYLQNSQDFAKLEQVNVAFEPKIQPYDLLDIVVLSPDEPATSMSYNLIIPSDMASRNLLTSQPSLQEYLVDAEGNVVKEIKVDAKEHTITALDVREPHLWNGMKDPYCYTAEAALESREDPGRYVPGFLELAEQESDGFCRRRVSKYIPAC